MPPFVRSADYTYDLPADRIAAFPVTPRDAARLLVCDRGQTAHHRYADLPHLLPPDVLLVFNDTRVIPARLFFRRATGALIELFLLQPVAPSPVVGQAMAQTAQCTWQCLIGNRKRWAAGEVLVGTWPHADGPLVLHATLTDPEQAHVALRWTPAALPFAEVVQTIGALPLPPYLRREATAADYDTYQTVYARQAGAVAAPTAGLHFTPDLLDALAAAGIARDFLTLHVSAGTFRPLSTDNAADHAMHHEQLVVRRDNVRQWLGPRRLVAVGTTSLRTLESTYWLGVRWLQAPDAARRDGFALDQHFAYADHAQPLPTRHEALHAVLDWMDSVGTDELPGQTALYVMPGYRFRMVDGLITNFHQPGSTLLLLVAALVGDAWRDLYAEALAQGYRFLSYGDGSLLWPAARD